MKAKLGYIGLGIMGGAMARNLLKAGFEVTVLNRSPAKMEALAADGATAASSPREVAEKSDIVFTNLPDSPDVEQVALGENGVIEGARDGLVFVDHSTIKPAIARKIADAFANVNVISLDAPVSGGDVGARDGTLTIMVGGEEAGLEKARPALEAMSKTITHVGPPGAGQIAKACNQIMAAAQMVAEAELLILAKSADVDPAKVIDAIKGGAAQCWTLDQKPPRLFQGNREPGFKAHMQLKDLDIVLATAEEFKSAMPMTKVVTELFREQVQAGEGELDNSAVIGVIERESGVNLLD
ncbi:MAG: NAD(P)-dependent oxidoreductase [Verrucomicrobiota bacterium]